MRSSLLYEAIICPMGWFKLPQAPFPPPLHPQVRPLQEASGGGLFFVGSSVLQSRANLSTRFWGCWR